MYPLKIDEKYNQFDLANLLHRFTTLYSWNYKTWDFNEWVWSHPWVDIFPPIPHSSVFCVLDWIVDKTWDDWAYWKFIIIKHINVLDPDNFSKKINLYSCYLHLSEVNVEKWEKLIEWSIIGKTGNTWMSSWEHLHFQIDREESPYHAYWPYTWSQIQSLWINFLDWVDEKLWYENLLKYTINPLVYLDNLEKHLKFNSIKETINSNIIEDKKNLNEDSNKIKEEVKEEEINEEIKKDNSLDLSSNLESLLSIYVNDDLLKTDEIIWINTDIDLVSSDDGILKNIITKADNLDLWIDDSIVIFTDVKNTDPYFEYINSLLNEWKITWFWDNTFRWDTFITRAELLKIIIKITNNKIIINNEKSFDDVPLSSWFKKYIDTAIALKIISTSNNLFRPNERISRAEALKMVINILKIDINKWINCEYLDVNWTEWYAKYINISCKYDLIPWVTDNFFPNKNITRRELIWIFFNYNKNK